MVKVFQIELPVKKPNPYTFGSSQTISSGYSVIEEEGSTLVIANTIKEVADKYPNAITIMEIRSKNVDILDNVKIVCPVKK